MSIPKPFLKPGVVHLQQIKPISLARFDIQLGILSPVELKQVKGALISLLNLQA